jgi:hypothetical protein
MEKGKFGEKKSIGYGYVGKWNDETLGWCMPRHLSDTRAGGVNTARVEGYNRDEPVYLCKITVEQIKDSLGRPIVKYLKDY